MVAQIKAWEPQASGPGGFADESALVSGLRAGRPEAYEALHAAYASGIYNLALRIVDDPHEAEDVAQEVLVKVLRGLPQEKGEFRLPAWLYRVTVNAAFDHVRARKRRPATVAEESAPEHASPVDEFERAELAHRIEVTLKGLSKRQQLALVLRDVHGLSVGETASVLGVTRPSADVLLSRARSGFRRLYLAGTRAAGRCAEADRILAGGVGRGVSARDRARLEHHTRTCPDCRRTVELWGVAPAGLALLLPQVALPAKLSLGATLAAAKAAGVGLPAGLGAAAAAGAAAGGGAAAGPGAATITGAAGAAASGAASAATAAGVNHGLLETLGSAAGVKIATLAAIATAALGVAEVTTHRGPEGHDAAGTAVTVGSSQSAGTSERKAGGSSASGSRLAEGRGEPGASDSAGLLEVRQQRVRRAAGNGGSDDRTAEARHRRSDRGQGKGLAATTRAARSGRGETVAKRASHNRQAWRASPGRSGAAAARRAGSGSSRKRDGNVRAGHTGAGGRSADQNGAGHSGKD